MIESKHVVDLSDAKDIEPSIEEIKSFREKMESVEKREPVDFASLIRQSKSAAANAIQDKSRKRKAKKAKKHVLAKKKKTIVHKKKKEQRKKKHVVTEQPTPPQKVLPSNLPKKKFQFYWPHISLPKISWPHFSFPHLHARRMWHMPIIVILCLLLPLPAFTMYTNLRNDSRQVIEMSTAGFLSLQQSTSAALKADTVTAQIELQDALQQFSIAEQLVEQDHKALADILSNIPFLGDQISSRRAILSAGQQIALANTYVLKGITDAENAEDVAMTERLSIITDHLQQALPQYKEAQRSLVSVDPSVLPKDQQEKYNEFLLLYSAFVDDLGDITDLSRVLYDVFGGSDFRRLLVLFQNNNEIRPTGGFIGSFAMVDTQKGNIKNIVIPGGGSYDIQGQFDEYIVPPVPLQLVNDRWEFQDINWFFDFPTTARKAEHVVESAEGTTFDGTIAVNASVIERLLRVIGPIDTGDYNMLLDAENVLPTLQSHVEDGYPEDEAPKEILSTVLDQMLQALQDIKPGQLLALLSELHEALSQKEIQVSLKDPSSNARLASFGWNGSIATTAARQDYLSVVATNVQGQKSDAKIQQDIEQTAEVQADGSVIEKVLIRRTHNGTPGETYYGASNIAYMRVYVPEGAVLLDAGGFTYPPEDAFHVPESWYKEDTDLARIEHEVGVHKETGTRITNQFGKTAFGNWMIIPAGETREAWVTYRLPFSVVDTKQEQKQSLASFFVQAPDAVSRYSLFVQKQSGVESTFTSSIHYANQWIPKWRSDDRVQFTPEGATFHTPLDTDTVYGVAFESQT